MGEILRLKEADLSPLPFLLFVPRRYANGSMPFDIRALLLRVSLMTLIAYRNGSATSPGSPGYGRRRMQGSGRTVTSNILPPELEKYRAAVESLSDRQRECLALVARGMISKRIGPKLGIMPGTVDKHVDKARVALNGMSRADAAQIVLAFETGREIQFVDTYFLPPPESLVISSKVERAATIPADHEADGHPDDDGQLVEEQGSYSLERLTTSLVDWVPLRSGRRPSNDLNQSKAIVTAAALGALALLLAGSAISLLTVMDSLTHP